MMRRPFGLIVLLAAGGLLALSQSSSGWKSDTHHPKLEYRVKCQREAATIEWRNGYPGEITLKAAIGGSGYDGAEDVTVAPGGSAQSALDTMSCSPDSFRVALSSFSMAPPPSPPPSAPASPVRVPAPDAPPQVPLVARYTPPVNNFPETSVEALASINKGMKQEEVLRKLGPPISRLTIPEEHELIETYRYRLVDDRYGLIRFSNGVVADIVGR
jgi:hypothetical protein